MTDNPTLGNDVSPQEENILVIFFPFKSNGDLRIQSMTA